MTGFGFFYQLLSVFSILPVTLPTKKKQNCLSHQLVFYHKKCKTVAGSKHYDKFTPADAQNTMGIKLMLVHRKLMIAEYHRPIILREPLSVSAANLKYLLIKLRQIYN